MTRRLFPAATILAALLCLSSVAHAGPCVPPRIDGGTGSGQVDAIDTDRKALLNYESCLAEQEELEEAFNVTAADRTAQQREAAANLRRTLDAWQRTRRAADAARVAAPNSLPSGS